MEFTGIRAIVTGGASGIGLATARLLAERGAAVACLDLSEPPEPLYGVRADVRDDAQVRTAVGQAVEHLGGLDVLVNNAGIGAQGTVEDNDDDEWSQRLRGQRVRHGADGPRGTAAPAPIRARRDRQHLLDRGHGRPAQPGAVLGHQGSRAVADPGDGRRPHS